MARLPLAPPSGDGEGRLAARAATLPTTRRSPHAPTRFSSRDLKVPLESRGAREGSREAREREVRGAREGSSRRARGKFEARERREREVEWPRVAFRNPIENCKFPIPHYQLAADSSHDSPRTGCSPFPRPRRWALALRPEHHPRSDQSGHVEQPACRTRCPKEPHAQRSWHLQRSLPAQSEDLRTEVWLAESLRRRAPRPTPRSHWLLDELLIPPPIPPCISGRGVYIRWEGVARHTVSRPPGPVPGFGRLALAASDRRLIQKGSHTSQCRGADKSPRLSYEVSRLYAHER